MAPSDSRPVEGPIDLASESEFTIGTMTVRPSTREVIIVGRIEVFEPRILQVLVLLARRRGTVVSRDELIQRCWNGRVVGDDAINRCVARLRRLSETDTAFTIETIPRVGYRLNELSADSQATSLSTDSLATSQPDSSAVVMKSDVPVHSATMKRRHPRQSIIVALSLITACICAGTYRVWHQQKSAAQTYAVQSIAVLSFISRNTDPDSQNFADNIATTVAATLNRAGLPVISTATTFKYRDDARSRIGKELSARYVIDGEVRRDGDTVHVVVRIDDGRSGYTLLANSFEASNTTASKLSTRVADFIASYAWAFRMRQLANANTEVTAVYFHSISRHLNGDNMAAFLEARSLAKKYPDDVMAQSLLAFVTASAYWQIPQPDIEASLLAARRANEHTRSLDSGYGDAYVTTSLLLPNHYWKEKEDWVRHGMAIDSETTLAAPFLAYTLASMGRLHDAEALERAAIERDPYFAYRASDHYYLLMVLGDEAGAASILARAEQYWPEDKTLITIRFYASDFRAKDSEAVRLMRDPNTAQIIEPPGTKPVVSTMMHALATHQDSDIRAANALCGPEWINNMATATCLSGLTALGRVDMAFEYAALRYTDQRASSPQLEDQRFLRREVSLPDTSYLFKPEFAPLRADSRFIKLTERIGLMDYWRHTHNYPDFCSSEHVPVCDAMKR